MLAEVGQKANVCMVCGGVLRAEDGHFHTRPVEQVCCECAGCDGEVALGSARTEVWRGSE